MHYKKYKTILSAHNGMNLYRGCTHGCIYCDSRSKCYQIDHDFEDIEVKQDAAEILLQQLRRKKKPVMIATGSMSDPYLHLETDLRLTGSCLEIIAHEGFGLSILTKSSRIERDMPILQEIQKRAKCIVQMTLTTLDPTLCAILEPHVCDTQKRADTLQKMKDNGLETIVWLGPILPFINDTEENLHGVLKLCANAGVSAILCFGFGMTLREGNREYFYQKLDEHFPELRQKYIRTYANQYSIGSPNHARLSKIFRDFCQEKRILSDSRQIFHRLFTLPEKNQQMRLF